MIHVIVKKKASQIVDLTIDGHAQSAQHGQDLVCAGVSASSVGVLNSLVQYGFLENKLGTIEMETGYIHITVNNYTKEVQVILETLETILKTIEETNEEFIVITKVEV